MTNCKVISFVSQKTKATPNRQEKKSPFELPLRQFTFNLILMDLNYQNLYIRRVFLVVVVVLSMAIRFKVK